MKYLFIFSFFLSAGIIAQSAHAENLTACASKTLNQSLYASGSGTAENPYGICSVDQLKNIELNPSASFQLQADLDFSKAGLSAEGWRPLFSNEKPFTGNLDGQGHTISNLVINRPSQDGAALIQTCTTCEIKNLKIVDAVVIGKSLSAVLVSNYIVRFDTASSEKPLGITNITVSGSVQGTSGSGGVFGTVYNVSEVLSEQLFLQNGVTFDGEILNTDFNGRDIGKISGSYEYD